jgi:DegT/DnrJ/EryC1/StrS aminotransferase family protein
MMSELAILGGSKIRTEPYPQWPVWDQRDIDAVTEVIKSGRWGGYPYPGPKTAELAKKFAEMQGGGYAVPMANGTVTMEVALRAAGVGWGDEVIVPAYTFQATASAPMAAGAIPVIVDVDPNNYCLDPKAVARAITAKTRAIIPVHLGSNMACRKAQLDRDRRLRACPWCEMERSGCRDDRPLWVILAPVVEDAHDRGRRHPVMPHARTRREGRLDH